MGSRRAGAAPQPVQRLRRQRHGELHRGLQQCLRQARGDPGRAPRRRVLRRPPPAAGERAAAARSRPGPCRRLRVRVVAAWRGLRRLPGPGFVAGAESGLSAVRHDRCRDARRVCDRCPHDSIPVRLPSRPPRSRRQGAAGAAGGSRPRPGLRRRRHRADRAVPARGRGAAARRRGRGAGVRGAAAGGSGAAAGVAARRVHGQRAAPHDPGRRPRRRRRDREVQRLPVPAVREHLRRLQAAQGRSGTARRRARSSS